MNSTIRSMRTGVRKGSAFAETASGPVNIRPDGRTVTVANVSDVADVEEYHYGPIHPHLPESQVLDHYRHVLKSKTGDTLVVLQDYECGHWGVVEYKTPEERESYLRNTLASYIAQVFGLFASR